MVEHERSIISQAIAERESQKRALKSTNASKMSHIHVDLESKLNKTFH